MGPATAVHLPDLIEQLLARGARVRMAVGGRSMAPRLTCHDVVTIVPQAGGRARFGDLVLFRNEHGALVLHRVLRRWRGRLQTRGDANVRLDPAIACERVLGRVSRIEKGDGSKIDLDCALERALAVLVGCLKLAGTGAYYKIRRRLTA